MPIKVTMLLQDQTNKASSNLGALSRIGGWSESWYVSGNNFQTAINAFISPTVAGGPVCQARAGILAAGAAIIGLRVQGVGGVVGPSQSLSVNFPGSYAETGSLGSGTTYQPSIGLLISVPAQSGPNIRRSVLRGLPANQVVDGEFRPTGVFSNNLTNFFTSLNGLAFRGRDLTQPSTKIIAISAAGVVTCEVAITVAVLQMVRILRSVNSAGTKVGGRFQVAAIGPGSNVFTLLGWTAGLTSLGTVRPDAIIYPFISGSAISPSRIITKKVGRPFFQFRGRRSARIR